MMDDFGDMPIDDDPYCLDDEPKISLIKKFEIENATIANVNLERIEHKNEKNDSLFIEVPTNKETSTSYEILDDAYKDVVTKKPKKRINVWTKTSTRKGTKKAKPFKTPNENQIEKTHEVDINEQYFLEDKNEIHLSKDQKAEKVELSMDKLQASSEKGYRMVRATCGVMEGAWYYEITIKALGKTGHTRLGWSTWKGDLQAPVGFDSNSYAYRDVDGSKVHKAIREPYGKAYFEGDVIGFYINLPNGAKYAPNYDHYVYKASKNSLSLPLEKKDCLPKRIPGSVISFFKNGIWQGIAFKDILGGEYFPAASMYTLPFPEKKCSVQFNFGPNYLFPPKDWNGHPNPQPMSKALPPKHPKNPQDFSLAPIEPSSTTNDSRTTKKWECKTKSNGLQRMTAKRGSSELLSGNESASRTKRILEEQDKGKRIRVYGKKGLFGGRGRKTIGLFPCPIITTKPRICNVLQQKKVIGKDCETTVKKVSRVPILVNNDLVESSDEQTE